jgi:hypothetical protein
VQLVLVCYGLLDAPAYWRLLLGASYLHRVGAGKPAACLQCHKNSPDYESCLDDATKQHTKYYIACWSSVSTIQVCSRYFIKCAPQTAAVPKAAVRRGSGEVGLPVSWAWLQWIDTR